MKKVVFVSSLFLLAAGLMLAAGCNEGKTEKKFVDKQSKAANKGDVARFAGGGSRPDGG